MGREAVAWRRQQLASWPPADTGTNLQGTTGQNLDSTETDQTLERAALAIWAAKTRRAPAYARREPDELDRTGQAWQWIMEEARAVVESFNQAASITVRTATLEDAKILFDWRNDALTRAMSRNSEPADFDNHISWLTARLGRPTPDLYVATLSTKSIGTFRIDGDEISYTIAPEHRGKGYGVSMLVEARRMFGVKRAGIFARNTASIAAAERAGMAVHIIDEDHSS